MKLKNILCLGALCFLVACGDSDMVKFSKEDLADPRLQYAFKEIKKENNNDNVEFYAIETIQKKYPKLYNIAKQKEIKNENELTISVYGINKSKNNIEMLYRVHCYNDLKTCDIKDQAKALLMYR